MRAITYLTFNGNAREVFKFYEEALGGKIISLMTYGQTPAAEHTSPEMKDKVIHARIQIGENIVMGSDAPPDRYDGPPAGFSITLMADTPEEAERLYKALVDGGSVFMALEETFFAKKFAMLNDKFGIPWMVICEKQP